MKARAWESRFLKHFERTRLIAHLVDTSDANDRDPVHDFEIIEHELAAFSPELAEKPMIVVATKLDATTDRDHLDELRDFAAKRGLEFHAISSATGEGIVELVRAMADALDRIPKPRPGEAGATQLATRMPSQSAATIAPHDSENHTDETRAAHAAPRPGGSLTSPRRAQEPTDTRIAARLRFLAARSIPFMPDTSPWRKPRSGDFISTPFISFRPRARRTKRKPALTPFLHRYAMVALGLRRSCRISIPSLAEAPRTAPRRTFSTRSIRSGASSASIPTIISISLSAPISSWKFPPGKITKRCSIPAISSSPAAPAFAWTLCAW